MEDFREMAEPPAAGQGDEASAIALKKPRLLWMRCRRTLRPSARRTTRAGTQLSRLLGRHPMQSTGDVQVGIDRTEYRLLSEEYPATAQRCEGRISNIIRSDCISLLPIVSASVKTVATQSKEKLHRPSRSGGAVRLRMPERARATARRQPKEC